MVAGKSSAKKLKIICFIFFKLYFFGGLVAGKLAAKKLTKYMFFFSKLYFLEGWSRENRRQKMERLELL